MASNRSTVGAGITPSGAITRYTLKGRASYALVRLENGQTVTSGSVDSFTSWSTSGSTVATLSAEQDAHRRLMIILADQVVARYIEVAQRAEGSAALLAAPVRFEEGRQAEVEDASVRGAKPARVVFRTGVTQIVGDDGGAVAETDDAAAGQCKRDDRNEPDSAAARRSGVAVPVRGRRSRGGSHRRSGR